MNAKVNISNRAMLVFLYVEWILIWQEVPRYWANGDAAFIFFMTAFQHCFQRANNFVNSTVQLENDPKLADPRLQKEISALLDKKQCIQRSIGLQMRLLNAYGYDVVIGGTNG